MVMYGQQKTDSPFPTSVIKRRAPLLNVSGFSFYDASGHQLSNTSTAQTIVTHLHINAEWASTLDRTESKFSVNAHIHYRVVVSVVGRPLNTFSNAKELFGVGLDAVRGEFLVFFIFIFIFVQ